jgi:hypothetical protein
MPIRFLRSVPVLLAAAGAASCCGIIEKSISLEAKNSLIEDIPCAVLVGDGVLRNADGRVVTTPAQITLQFECDPASGEYRPVKLGVKPVEVDAAGNVIRGLNRGEEGAYIEETRHVEIEDAATQVFLLARRKQ